MELCWKVVKDPVITEIWRHKQEIGEAFGFDVMALGRSLQQRESGDPRFKTPGGQTSRRIPCDSSQWLGLAFLRMFLPAAFGVLEDGGSIVCLITPQFELEREDIGKGGIVRDPALHARAVAKIRAFVTEELAREWKGLIDSPITGKDGNREFLVWLG